MSMYPDVISVREFQNRFKAGDFDAPDVTTQCEAGWYDWFCKDTSLVNKTKRMGKIVAKLKDSKYINLDTMYVWFKNNCPCSYPLYDDFRLADVETGDVQFTISIDCGYDREKYDDPHNRYHTAKFCVWSRLNDFEVPLFFCSTSKELVEFLNTPAES